MAIADRPSKGRTVSFHWPRVSSAWKRKECRKFRAETFLPQVRKRVLSPWQNGRRDAVGRQAETRLTFPNLSQRRRRNFNGSKVGNKNEADTSPPPEQLTD